MADTSNLSKFLTDIADAIRTKKSTTEPIAAGQFDQEILSIEAGMDTSDATATADDIQIWRTAYVNGEKIEGRIPTMNESSILGISNNNSVITDVPNNDYEQQLQELETRYPNKDTDPYEKEMYETELSYITKGVVRVVTDYSQVSQNSKMIIDDSKGKGITSEINYDILTEAINLTPNKIASGNTILGIEGTAEGGVSAEVELFATESEMRNTDTPVGTKALVYDESNEIFNGLYIVEEKTDKYGIAITPISNLYANSSRYVTMLDSTNYEGRYVNLDLFAKNLNDYFITNHSGVGSSGIKLIVYVDENTGHYLLYFYISGTSAASFGMSFPAAAGTETGMAGIITSSYGTGYKLIINKETYEITSETFGYSPKTVYFPNIKFGFAININPTTNTYASSTSSSLSAYNGEFVRSNPYTSSAFTINRLLAVTYKNYAILPTQLTNIEPNQLVQGTVYGANGVITSDGSIWNNIPKNITLGETLGIPVVGNYYSTGSDDSVYLSTKSPNDINNEPVSVKYLKHCDSTDISDSTHIIIQPTKFNTDSDICYISSNGEGMLKGTTYTNTTLNITKEIDINKDIIWYIKNDICIFVNSMGVFTLNLESGEVITLVEKYTTNTLDRMHAVCNILNDKYVYLSVVGMYHTDKYYSMFRGYCYDIDSAQLYLVASDDFNSTYQYYGYSGATGMIYNSNEMYTMYGYSIPSSSSSASGATKIYKSIVGTNTYSSVKLSSPAQMGDANGLVVTDSKIIVAPSASETSVQVLNTTSSSYSPHHIEYDSTGLPDNIHTVEPLYNHGTQYMLIQTKDNSIYVCKATATLSGTTATLTKSGLLYDLGNYSSVPGINIGGTIYSMDIGQSTFRNQTLSTYYTRDNKINIVWNNDELYLLSKKQVIGLMKAERYIDSSIIDYDLSIILGNANTLSLSSKNTVYYTTITKNSYNDTITPQEYNTAVNTANEILGDEEE